MTTLIKSLPSWDGSALYVYNNETYTGNTITPAQVEAAKAKGWTAMQWDESKESWVNYEGEEPYLTVDETNFPDEKFLAWLIKQDYGADKKLTDAEIASIKEIDVSNQGLYHMNPVQMLYGFLMGLVITWCYFRYRRLSLAVFMHALANLVGLLYTLI